MFHQHKYSRQLCTYTFQFHISEVICATMARPELTRKYIFLLIFRDLLVTVNIVLDFISNMTINK